MNTININVSKNYNVIIGSGLLKDVGERIKEVIISSKIAVVTDDTVEKLYFNRVSSSLEKNSFEVVKFVIPHGEKSKSSENYIKLLNFLCKNHLTRSDCIIALGGGVVGDLAGFAAATYLRGIHFVQCPTTLLAAVDSSVGGKTAIDLESGKNLAGAFYQPDLVICDYDTLSTLPKDIFIDGSSEVIKYGGIFDEKLLNHLEEKKLNFDIEYIISQCVELKRKTVTEDEFDNGTRQLLNFGHTLGHSVEALSQYTISHGQAVAIGMCVISRASAKNGICSQECCDSLISLINEFGLPTDTEFDEKSLFSIIENDKKRKGNSITVVLPKKRGQCILKTMTLQEFKEFI